MGEYVEEGLAEERPRLPNTVHAISISGVPLEIRHKKANGRNPASNVKEHLRGLKHAAPHPILEDVDEIVEGRIRELIIRKVRADLRVHLVFSRRGNLTPAVSGRRPNRALSRSSRSASGR